MSADGGKRNIYTDIVEAVEIAFVEQREGEIGIHYTISAWLLEEYGEDEIRNAIRECLRAGAKLA